MKKSVKLLVRLDDACPFMDKKKWSQIESILDDYSLRPMVGIIPHCEDSNLIKDEYDPHFWDRAYIWQNKGWGIALHGYNHTYISNNSGINPFWNRSEFAGVGLDFQKQKIRDGYSILKHHKLKPKYFFAPSHTFDNNTIKALIEESDIRIISDTIGLKPYKYKGIYVIPQQIGHFCNLKIPGYWTICFHPNNMNDKQIEEFRLFIETNRNNFISFDQIDLHKTSHKDIISHLFSFLYFLKRKINGKK